MSGSGLGAEESGELSVAVADARQRAEAGDLITARATLEQALAAAELRLGRDHPDLAPAMIDLATIAREVGNLTEAQTQLRRAHGILELSVGADHERTLAVEARLAAVLHRLGEPTYRHDWHLVESGGQVLGPDHKIVRAARSRLSTAASETEKHGVVRPPRASTVDIQGPRNGVVRPVAEGVFAVSPPARREVDLDSYVPVAPEISPTRGRGAGLALAAIAGMAVLVAGGVVAVKALGNREEPTGPGTVVTATAPPSDVPTVTNPPAGTTSTTNPPASPSGPAAAEPPSDVKLTDAGGSVTITWRDPSGGAVPFIVTGGRLGQPASALDTVPIGRTRSIIYGLNRNFEYCFSVVAVYDTDVVATSARVCTRRLSTR